ncbi:hypothetical protein [Serratia proteamaculans]
MDNKLSELKDVADYWRKVKSGELPAPGPNEISITVCTLDGAVSRIAALLAELEAKDKRIAEVEGSHKKLRETLAAVHNTITGGGAYTSLAGILTAVKRAYLESSDASACTVTVEGDD